MTIYEIKLADRVVTLNKVLVNYTIRQLGLSMDDM